MTAGAAALPLNDRIRILAAGEEAGFLAVFRDQVRLGEALEQALVLQRLDGAADVVLRVEEEQVEEVAEHQLAVVKGRRGGLPGRRPAEPAAVVDAGGEEVHAQFLHRAAADFREPHAQHHLVARDAFLLAQQVDDVFLLLDVAGGHFGRLVDDVLAADRAGDHDVLAVAVDGDRLTREQLLHLLHQLAQVAADDDLVALDAAGAVPHEHARSCPAPCRGSAAGCGVVTIASATLGLVSETRVMFDPTLSSVERPDQQRDLGGRRVSAAAAAAMAPSPV